MKLIDSIKEMFGIGEPLDDEYEPGSEEEGYGLENAEGSENEDGESRIQAIIEKIRENKVVVGAGVAVVVILIFIILGLSVHKTKVDAVLSDQEQGELIDAISEQLSTLEGQVVTKDEADEIAATVVEESFPDLLTTTMKGYSQEEIIEIVRPTIEEYLKDNDIELTEEEITEITKVVSKNIQAENEKLRKDVLKLQSDLKALQEEARKNKESGRTTSSSSTRDYSNEIKNLNSAVASNKSEIAANRSGITSLNKGLNSVESDIKDLKKKVKAEYVSIAMTEYVFKGEKGNWIADSKSHKSGSLTAADFCKALAGNDNEMRKAVNELQPYLDKKLSELSEKESNLEKRLASDEARLDSAEAKAKDVEASLNGCSIVVEGGALYIVAPDGTRHAVGTRESTEDSRYTDPVTGYIYVINKKNGKALIFDVDIDGDYEIEDDTLPEYVYMPNDYARSNPIPVDPDSRLQDDPDKWYKNYFRGRTLSAKYLSASTAAIASAGEDDRIRRSYEEYSGYGSDYGDYNDDGWRYESPVEEEEENGFSYGEHEPEIVEEPEKEDEPDAGSPVSGNAADPESGDNRTEMGDERKRPVFEPVGDMFPDIFLPVEEWGAPLTPKEDDEAGTVSGNRR